MTDQDEARIRELEARIEEMRPLMAEKKEAIASTTADALAAFWPDFVSECVRASGDELSNLPQEEVARIKEEVAAITKDPVSAADNGLERADWPHERASERLTAEDSGSQFNDALRSYDWLPQKGRGPERGPSALHEVVQVAAATPAVPISSAGLQTPRAGASQGKPLAAWDFSWTEDMLGAATSYGELVKQLAETVRDLCEARRSRDRNDAQDIWDRA